VVARAIARIAPGKASVLVLAHPTRGVDVAASRAIHAEIAAVAAGGAAVLILSADLHELRTLADRILVLSRGQVSAELPPTATDAEIGRAMLAGFARAEASP
jgi:simple sugar transport system ATP-binding protein